MERTIGGIEQWEEVFIDIAQRRRSGNFIFRSGMESLTLSFHSGRFIDFVRNGVLPGQELFQHLNRLGLAPVETARSDFPDYESLWKAAQSIFEEKGLTSKEFQTVIEERRRTVFLGLEQLGEGLGGFENLTPEYEQEYIRPLPVRSLLVEVLGEEQERETDLPLLELNARSELSEEQLSELSPIARLVLAGLSETLDSSELLQRGCFLPQSLLTALRELEEAGAVRKVSERRDRQAPKKDFGSLDELMGAFEESCDQAFQEARGVEPKEEAVVQLEEKEKPQPKKKAPRGDERSLNERLLYSPRTAEVIVGLLFLLSLWIPVFLWRDTFRVFGL